MESLAGTPSNDFADDVADHTERKRDHRPDEIGGRSEQTRMSGIFGGGRSGRFLTGFHGLRRSGCFGRAGLCWPAQPGALIATASNSIGRRFLNWFIKSRSRESGTDFPDTAKRMPWGALFKARNGEKKPEQDRESCKFSQFAQTKQTSRAGNSAQNQREDAQRNPTHSPSLSKRHRELLWVRESAASWALLLTGYNAAVSIAYRQHLLTSSTEPNYEVLEIANANESARTRFWDGRHFNREDISSQPEHHCEL